MKKRNKYLLATGGILCMAGILSFGIGVAAGGRNYVKQADLNKISGSARMDSEENHAILEKTRIDPFVSVNIDFQNIDLDIRESEDDDFYLSYNIETNDGKNPVSWKVENQVLDIAETAGHQSNTYIHIDINFLQELLGHSHVMENTNKVTIFIPKQTKLDAFSCKMGLGDLDVVGLHSRQTAISCSDGDMTIRNSVFGELELKTDLGDLFMQDTSCTNSQITMTDGDFKTQNVTFNGENKITSSLGDITLCIPEENLKDLSVQAETKLGDIKAPEELETAIREEDDDTILSADSQKENTMEIQSSDGDITIEFFGH